MMSDDRPRRTSVERCWFVLASTAIHDPPGRKPRPVTRRRQAKEQSSAGTEALNLIPRVRFAKRSGHSIASR